MNRRLRCFLILGLLMGSLTAASATDPKKIVLIAGPITGHPKESHEYEKNVILLKHLLETSPDLQGRVRVEAHFKGWPKDPSTLDDADTIFFTTDGGDHNEKDHPLYVGDRLQILAKQMKRGCGVVFFHWSTFNPSRFHDQVTEWAGGYFDYETGAGPNRWYSAIQTWSAESKLGTPDHPIARGVKPFSTQEEYYYRMRFRDSDPRLKPIIVTRPPKETNDFAVGWAVERADGGRGFGFTGGHFYQNWWNPDFRKLVLNAIVWTAGLEVPATGVRSEPFDRFKALIVTGHNHPAHEWRSTTAALILALEQDPRAIVHVTENPEDLATDKIKDYDVLVMNYCNWDRPGLSAAARTNFVRYLENGGGLSVIHFANGAFTDTLPNKDSDWPEYRTRIVRRIWDHRPGLSGHDAYGPFRVEITGAKHPIAGGLASFDTVDELYFRQQGELPIEPFAFASSKETGQREPLAWAYDYGKGRVFQTVLGHSDESIRKAAALIRRGTVWAAGRNQLSFDPPSELTEGALFRSGSPWTVQDSLKRVAATQPPEPARPQATPSPSRDSNSRLAGAPAVSGADPVTQGEKDWVDNRWSRTDVGPLLASNLKTPTGNIAKALSIRVGGTNEGAVVYDTATCTMRAAWTGGFLRFDPARFGLIRAPEIEGKIMWAAPGKFGWEGSPPRFAGFHLHGQRVVLEYRRGETRLLESPSLAVTEQGPVFIRHLSIAPHDDRFRWPVVAPDKGSQPAVQTAIVSHSGPDGVKITREARRMVWTNDAVVKVLSIVGLQGSTMSVSETGMHLETRSGDRPERFTVALWQGPPAALEAHLEWVKHHVREESPESWLAPGPGRWQPALETVGQPAPDSGPFAIDTLTVPYDNPWNALMYLSGVDFTGDGAAYVCSIHGDVWKVTGIDESLKKLRWQRFATGLFQPLGLKVVKDRVYVLGRDQITILHDENGDGETDFYQNFNNSIATSTGGHDYVTSLETDATGNFHYVDPLGAHRISADGTSNETLATGFRNPNGLGASPDGRVVTIAPQQGEWTPSSLIAEIKSGGYYGYGGPKVTPDRPLGYDPVLCWIPHGVDNSSGSQIWVPKDRWGALGGQMLHFSWGRCAMMLVLREVADGVAQGAVVPLPGRFLSGAMRGAFHPKDGHLYVVGSTGWQTSAIKDGSFQRVRRTSKPLIVPIGWSARATGIELTFPEAMEKESAVDPGSYDVQQWNYRYAAEYGSKDWSVVDPKKEGRDTLPVKSARLSSDGRTVFLEIPGLQPVMQMQIQYNLTSANGSAVRGKVYPTINRLSPPR